MVVNVPYRTIVKPLFVKAVAATIVLGLAISIGRAVVQPSSIRTLLGLVLIFLILAIGLWKPNVSVVLAVIYLPILGLIRRILIPIAGWGSFDPLVLVPSVFALFIGSYWFYRHLFLRETLTNDSSIFRLVRWMILIDMLEIVNPKQGSPFVGIGGIIFYVVPLFWMVTARTVVNENTMKIVLHTTFVMGVLAGLYGLKQTYFGFFPFEYDWIHIVHITSLHVGNRYRALSTTDNPQEYAELLAQAICIAWVYILREKFVIKVIGAFGVAVLGWALFMESARGPLILAAIGIALITILYAKTVKSKMFTGLIVVSILTAIVWKISHIQVGSNALVEHQIAGITGQDSSLSGHMARMFSGIWKGTKSVIGYGLGSTTTAAGKFGSLGSGTEVDYSNMFVSDGVIGGGLYLILMVRMFVLSLRRAASRAFIPLCTFGLLVALFQQWVNGELYAPTAILWIAIGYLDSSSLKISESLTQ